MSAAAKGKLIDLDALANPARQAAVRWRGVEYPVSPITGRAAQRIATAYEGESAAEIVSAMTAAARESVPSMPDAVFDTLSVEGISMIVGIARDGADAVEAMLAERAKAERDREGAAGN